jgi:hypothetical protein
MSNASDAIGTPPPPPYRNSDAAPFIYFDIVPTYGNLGGSIQLELAARILSPTPGGDNEVAVEFVSVAHLRCSPMAANYLRDSLNAALKMLEGTQGVPSVAIGKLN